jgi:hypothetical protein
MHPEAHSSIELYPMTAGGSELASRIYENEVALKMLHLSFWLCIFQKTFVIIKGARARIMELE